MKHYAGLDLSMESTQVCIVDENGRKLLSDKIDSSPEALALMLERHGPIERAVVETGRMSPAICLGLRELGVPVVNPLRAALRMAELLVSSGLSHSKRTYPTPRKIAEGLAAV